MARDPDLGVTPKQKEFADLYVENGGNGTAAALESYDTDSYSTAAAIASENLKKPNVVEYLRIIGASNHVTPNRLFSRLDRALDAAKPIISPSGEIVKHPETGETVKADDWGTQLKAVEISARLLGLYAHSDGDGNGSGSGARHLHLHAASSDQLESILEGRPVKKGRVKSVPQSETSDANLGKPELEVSDSSTANLSNHGRSKKK